MTREAFMKELVYLLQDIQDEDKEDAIQYYIDYFDEAGSEHESEVIRELGSPERISAIIRSDIAGHLEKGGEFTESGYQDERFRDPNYQVARRFDLPKKQDRKWPDRGRDRENSKDWNWPDKDGSWQKEKRTGAKNRTAFGPNFILKIILLGILIIVALRIILSIGGGAIGIIAAALGILLFLLIFTGLVTIVMLVSGVAMLPYGVVHMFFQPLDGILLSGTGLIFLGTGGVLLALSMLFYGRFIPFLIRSIVDSLNRLFHRRRY